MTPSSSVKAWANRAEKKKKDAEERWGQDAAPYDLYADWKIFSRSAVKLEPIP